MNPQPSPQFVHAEDDLVNDLGITRDLLRKNREKKGADWGPGANGLICWTTEAVDRLRLALKIPGEKTGPPDAEIATVSTKRVVNQKIVLAIRSNGQVVKVGLGGSAALFWAPMQLLIRPGATDLWHWIGNPDRPQAGRRLPRRKGKW